MICFTRMSMFVCFPASLITQIAFVCLHVYIYIYIGAIGSGPSRQPYSCCGNERMSLFGAASCVQEAEGAKVILQLKRTLAGTKPYQTSGSSSPCS